MGQLELHQAKILIVDDQRSNVALLRKMLASAGYTNILSTTDSREVAPMYQEHDPDLILLDLVMPHLDGFQVIEQLQEMVRGKDTYLPILVLTAKNDQQNRLRALNLGARDFLGKPFNRLEVLVRINNMLEVRLLHNQIKNQNKLLEEKVRERTQEVRDTQLEIVRRLGRAAEYRDSETGLHIVRMSLAAARLGRVAGMSEKDCELLLHSSTMHDIGKIGIPDRVLLKPGKLDAEEWKIMQSHATIGAQMLTGSENALLKMAEAIALTHHEKWDGSGYPNGLKGEEIPLVGRISAISDVFDALTTERPYKKAWPLEKVVSLLISEKGKHFDPRLVDLFLEILPEVLEEREKLKDDHTP